MGLCDASPDQRLAVFDLHIPDRRRPFRTILNCPERLLVAWHRDCRGVCELLDRDGRSRYGRPDGRLWDVREYQRVEHWGTGARYV